MNLEGIQIQPGEVKTFSTSFAELLAAYANVEDLEAAVRFSVLDTTNLYVTLSSLPADFDLYIGEINPDTNGPYFDVNDDIYTVYNSSTNPGLEPELVFGRLNPGHYWLQIVPRVGGNEELLDVEFEWSLDGQTFDETTLLSNDEFLPLQWHLFNTGIVRNWSDIGGQWLSAPNVDIGAPEAWNLVFNADIPIAIIDSGVDVTHPDLISNLWVNPGEIPGNGEDDDNNGFTDDIHGWNFVNDTPDMTVDAHGTHVAGISGAQGNNGIGVSGVAWNTQLMVLDVFGGNQRTEESDVQEALYYAIDHGAKVINMSLGGNEKISPQDFLARSDSFVEQYKAVFEYAYEHDVFIAIAAGNEGSEFSDRRQWDNVGNFDQFTVAPAVFSQLFGNIASVGSSNAQNYQSSYSNYGQSISISAPGGDGGTVVVDRDEFGIPRYASTDQAQILSTLPVGTGDVGDGNYGYSVGTSMASPVIAGMAGLIRSQDSSITATETLAILRAGAFQNRRLRFGENQNFQANLYRSLLLAQGWQGPDTLTGIGQDIAPVLNLSSLTTAQRLTGTLDWSGQTPYDPVIGFYQVLDLEGTVLDALGNPVKPGDANYQSVALGAGNVVDQLDGIGLDANTSNSIDYVLSGSINGVYLAPYAVLEGSTWFAWDEANSDGLDHFKVLDENQFGFLAASESGDNDSFTDVVMTFSSSQIL